MSTPPKSAANQTEDALAALRTQVAELRAELDSQREQAGFFRQVLESVPEYVLTLGPDLRFTYVNNQTDAYPHTMVGVHLSEVVVPADMPRFEQQLRRVFERGEAVVCEGTGSKDGRLYESHFKPIYQDGKVILAVANSRDITEQRIEQRVQDETEARWRIILSQVPFVLWTCDTELRFTSSIGQRLDRLGLKPNQVVGKTVYEFLDTDDSEFPPIRATRAALGGVSSSFEITMEGVDFECQVEPLRDQDERIIGTVGIAIDVTEHRRLQEELTRQRDELEKRVAERTSQLATINDRLHSDIRRREEVESQLRESEERFRTMAEGSPVPVVISDPETGQIFYGNHRLAEMFRTPYETLTEQLTLDFYLYPEQRGELVSRMRSEGFVNGAEVQLKRADGVPLWAAVYNRTIIYNGQQALLACFLDTTEWKAAEEALLKDRRLLRRLLDLNERDRQLIAYEIHDGVVQDMSGALMFLESASHQLFTEGREIEELSKACQLLRDGIDEARRIIDGLRPPVLEEAGIIAAVENLVVESNELGPLKIKLTHSVHFDRLAPPIEMAIYRIVQEGVNNARQHSGGGHVWVNITQQWTYIYISIRDDGCGFDPKVTKKRRYGLQGIHERARLLGGSEIIDSAPGRGTEIRVTLPISDALLPPEE